MVKFFEAIYHDKVCYEFTDNQTLQENDLPSGAFDDDAKVIEEKVDGNEVFHYRMVFCSDL